MTDRQGVKNGSISARTKARTPSPVRQALRGALLALLLWVTWSAAHILYSSPGHVSVEVGAISPRDIEAPRDLVYISNVRTQEARDRAATQVGDVYVGPQREVVSRQLYLLGEAIGHIGQVRQDPLSTRKQKAAQLLDTPDVRLGQLAVESILDLSDAEWEDTAQESVRVLDIVLRDEIRPADVAEARRRAQLLVTHTLSPDQRLVALALVQGLIAPNSLYDAEATAALRRQAREDTDPVRLTINRGESILRKGDYVTIQAHEKLQVLGLLDRDLDPQSAIGVALLFLALVFIIAFYVVRAQPLLLGRPRRAFLFTLTLLLVGVSARIAIPGHTLLPYLFPTAGAVMLVAILVDVHLGMVVAVAGAILVGYNSNAPMELALYTLVGSVVGGLTVWHMDHLGAFVRAALYVALAHMAVILGFRLRTFDVDAVGLFQLLSLAIGNAVLSSSLTFVAFAVIGRLFGIATSLQLLELARPTHPLFRRLLIEAPGSYHHSILVSNMAERAAEAIGADALLSRVGSYYHDVGKIERPYFFGENQSDGENPHDDLEPKVSAEIILGHPQEGLRLARRYRIPDRVADFIPEHHGTTLVSYFYRRALQESEDGVDEADYRYKGPRPQSKETAIVMLADSVEAWIRSNKPSTQAEMERVIRRVINDRLISGQLDECDLTLKDLDAIRESFVSVLKGVYHPRVRYPERSERQSRRPEYKPKSSASEAPAAGTTSS